MSPFALQDRAPRVLLLVTYYLPYLSGLTIFAQRLAQALASQGVEVAVLTSQHQRNLASEEVLEGIRVYRTPVWGRLGKGVFLPGLPWQFCNLARFADVVLLVLPQAEAGFLAALAKRWLAKPVVAVLLCDVELGRGLRQRYVQALLRVLHRWAFHQADRVVTLTEDYAEQTPILQGLKGKLCVIPPPIPPPRVLPERVVAVRKAWGLGPKELLVGWVGRVSREKGLEILAQAMPLVWERLPGVRVLCAGPKEEVVGEASYRRQLDGLLSQFGSKWTFTGILPEEDLAALYACLSVLVLPSLNRTEAFGMVQVEAMACGTPVVASDLPGVREPVRTTGMGFLVPPGEPKALAQALLQVLQAPKSFPRTSPGALGAYAPSSVAGKYMRLFSQLGSAKFGIG
ncbi:MAG: glycosyltransferase family 4 protein [Thermoanaerobaculaceae bacterium]